MAQPGNFTPILLYGSSTPGNAPVAANLTNSATGSEIAINVADKNLFFKDSGGVVNTMPIRQSSTSSNGWLSSTDWNTFNNKQPSGAYLTAVTADAPLSGSGTSASHLVIAQANTSTSGYLSSTDWNTFNGKQAALVSGTNIKTVGGVSLLGPGDVGTIGVGYGGTGLTTLTAGYIPYGNGASAFSSSANLQFNGAILGIGIAPNSWASGINGIQMTGGVSAVTGDTRQYFSCNAYIASATSLDTYITSNYALSYRQDATGGTHNWLYAAPGSAGGTISFTTGMRLDSSGNLLIGTTTSGTQKLIVKATSGAAAAALIAQGAAGAASDIIYFFASNASTLLGYISYNGATTLYNATSDQRLKTNIIPAPLALNKINSIQVKSFDWIEGNFHTDFGFIAQELEKIVPEAVSIGKDKENGEIEIPWAIDNSVLVPSLVKAIQELSAKVTALELQLQGK